MNNLDALWPKIVEMAREIHATPELRFEEKRAASLQAELLRNAGFDVESPYGGFDTAFRARFGKGKPVLAYTSEYDALPDIGHACGHHLIAASSIGAAIVVARQIEEQGADGQVWIIGTPGEEMGGGKVLMLENGAFEDADAVLQAHPADCDATDPGMNGVIRYDVAFRGLEAHAAAAPEEGRNALDGVLLFFQGINAWRQHLPDSSRVHGIVTDGGAAPNIVPAHAGCCFYLRSPDNAFLDNMVERFKQIAQGAALMSDTEVSIKQVSVRYKAGTPNPALNRAFIEAADRKGVEVRVLGERRRSSSDFGNISEALPAAQMRFNICPDGESAKLHTVKFREFSAQPLAYERTRTTAKALGAVGWRFLSDATFRDEVTKSQHT